MKKYFLILAAAALIFTSCEKSYLVLEGRVYNMQTNEALSGVKVTLETTSEKKVIETTTNDDGFYSIGKVLAGQYIIKLQKPGFLATLEAIGLGGTDIIVEQTVSRVTYLDPMTEKYEFNVFKQYMGNIETAVAEQEFTIYLSEATEPIVEETDEYGFVELDSMPSSIVIKFDFVEKGIVYKSVSTVFAGQSSLLIQGQTTGGQLGIVSCNLLDDEGAGLLEFEVDETIEITFTQSIDVDNATIELYENGWLLIDGEGDWSDNDMTFTFEPDNDLEDATNYDFVISVQNVDNTSNYWRTISFTTEE